MRRALVVSFVVPLALSLVTIACSSAASTADPSTPPPSIVAPVGPQPLPSPASTAENPAKQPDGTFAWVPVSARVLPGVVYTYTLFTHCGLMPTAFDFDGSFWDPAGEATPELAQPEDSGTIQLLTPDEAVFTTAAGARIGLRRSADRTREGFPCD